MKGADPWKKGGVLLLYQQGCQQGCCELLELLMYWEQSPGRKKVWLDVLLLIYLFNRLAALLQNRLKYCGTSILIIGC